MKKSIFVILTFSCDLTMIGKRERESKKEQERGEREEEEERGE